MRTNFILILVAMFVTTFSLQAQDETLEELSTMLADRQAVKEGIDKEIADLDKRIKEFPGWTKGLGGTVGFNFGGANDWFGQDIENSSSSGFGLDVGGYANNNGDGYFWHNGLKIAYTTTKTTIQDLNDDGSLDPEQELTNNASYFNLKSIGGKELFSNVFASAEANYETTFNKFNDPGTLTFSAGLTWKPINDLIVIIHPLAYQINFPSGDLASASGAKIGATYTGEIYPGVAWTSDLNAFLAYGGSDEKARPDGELFSAGDLSNWTWFNTFAVKDVFKGIGVGASLGLRNNKQLGFAKGISDPGLQTIYTLGLSYAL